jgi:hypothetical protein
MNFILKDISFPIIALEHYLLKKKLKSQQNIPNSSG